ncbi:hypothetical protein LINGRAHAP2_LOCUS4795 [Linum grandiflorum]
MEFGSLEEVLHGRYPKPEMIELW